MLARILAPLIVLAATCTPALAGTTTYGELRCATPDPIRSQLFESGNHTLAGFGFYFDPANAMASGQLSQIVVMMIGSGSASAGNFGFFVFDRVNGSAAPYPTGLLSKPNRIVFAKLGASSVTQVAGLGSGRSLYKVTFNVPAGSFAIARRTELFICPWRIGSDSYDWSIARVNPSYPNTTTAVRCPNFSIPWWTGMPYPYNNADLAMTVKVSYPIPGER